MSGVVISKSSSVVVVPSEPVKATGDIILSSYDKIYGPLEMTVLFAFEHPTQDPVETIKRGLSQALVHYYPVAGRFAAGPTAGEVVVKCTGAGVSVVGASANCAIKDVQDLSDPTMREELAIFYPAHEAFRYSEVEPLVLMQVTVFSCGGFVLGVTWRHCFADGIGMGQFLQAVGELARGLPSPSVVPVRQGDSLISGMPPACKHFFELQGSLQPCAQMPVLDVTVQSSLINRIKIKFAQMNSGRPCTVFEAVTAVLWRCRTRAIMSYPEAVAVLSFTANARKYAGAKEGFYGNCVMPRLVTTTTGAVANGDVVDLAKMVQRAKYRVLDQPDIHGLLQLDGYNHLGISCWRNIGFEAPDFGAGRPTTVRGHSRYTPPMPFCSTCAPCKDDYNVISICVKEEHAGAFLHELAKIHLIYM